MNTIAQSWAVSGGTLSLVLATSTPMAVRQINVSLGFESATVTL